MEISEETFNCTCVSGWEGHRCERSINYCNNISCENRGVCRSLVSGPICECLSDYSGEFCQETAMRIVIYQLLSKSFAYVAAFVIMMDILKYCFGIDSIEEERERMRRDKQAKKRRRPIIERFVYVNALTDPSTPQRRLSAIAETTNE